MNIIQVVTDYIELNKNNEPVIVFDGDAVPDYKVNKVEGLCGGKAKLDKTILSFFEKLRSLNVQMFFLYPLDNLPEKYAYKKITNNKEIMKCIRKGKVLEEIVKRDIPRVRKDYLIDMAKKFGEIVYVNCSKEFMHREFGPFAVQKNAVAIVTDKTKTIYFAGTIPVWSAHDIDFEGLTTQKSDFTEFCECAVPIDKLLLLGVLIAENKLNLVDPHYEVLNEIVKFVSKFRNQSELFEFVRNHNVSNLESLVIDMGMSEEMLKLLGDYINSLCTFDSNTMLNDSPILQYIRKNCINIYAAIRNTSVVITCNFFDNTRYAPLTYMDLVQPICGRRGGFLVKIDENLPIRRKHVINYKTVMVIEHVVPPFNVPDFFQLLNQREFPDIDDKRYEILVWIMGWEDLLPSSLQTVPREFFITILILYHLKLVRIVNEGYHLAYLTIFFTNIIYLFKILFDHSLRTVLSQTTRRT